MSSRSYQSAQSHPTHCNCGLPVAVKQSWTSRNPGRHFACCKFYGPGSGGYGCNYFEWVDFPMVEWQKNVTNLLLVEKKLLEKDNEMLKLEVCKLQDRNCNVVADLDSLRAKYRKVIADNKAKGKRRVNGATVQLKVMVVVVFFVVVLFAFLGRQF